MKLGAVVIISISIFNGIGANEVSTSFFLISRDIRISDIAMISANSTTKPGRIKASDKSVPTAATTISIAKPTMSVKIRT